MADHVEVHVHNRPVEAQRITLIGLLLALGFILAFWKYLLVLAVAAAAGVVTSVLVKRWYENQEALAARADAQHALVCQGDPRGIYGESADS